MAPPRCLCKAVFGTSTALRIHALQHGHSLQCGCGEYFANQETLSEHQENDEGDCGSIIIKRLIVDGNQPWAKNLFYCRVCGGTAWDNIDKRDKHLEICHFACPTCLQTFASSAARDEHQKTTSHCYCSDCCEDNGTSSGKVFSSLEVLARHSCTDEPEATYECLTCGDSYDDALDFANHIRLEEHVIKNVAQEAQVVAAAEQLASVEKSNLWCEQCKMRFVSVGGFGAHKTSNKHKAPMVAIKCSCGRDYSFLSNFIAHLESSACSGGMTRNKLNAIVYRYDTDRRLTSTEYIDQVRFSLITESSEASIAPTDSASVNGLSLESLSLDSSVGRERIYTPNDSDATSTVSSQGGVILTPDGSDHTSTDSESINTPPASDTSSALSDGSARLARSARSVASTSSSGSESVFTPRSSTINDRATPPASIQSSDSAGDEDDLTPSGSSVDDATGEWSFINSSTIVTPSATSIDGSSVSTIRFDTVAKVWSCSKCTRTFPTEYALRQHMNSAVHLPKLFHCPPAEPHATPIHQNDRKFNSMSGLVQHIENGSCNGGVEALKAVLEIMEKPMQKKLKTSIISLEK